MNNSERLHLLAKGLIKNTEDIARKTGLAFDVVLGMTIQEFSRQNPGKPEAYYQKLFRDVLCSTRGKYNNVIVFPAKYGKAHTAQTDKETR